MIAKASGEYYSELVRGRAAIARPPGTTSHFNRRNYSGKKVAKLGDYEPAVALGHTAVLLLSEITGGIYPPSYSFLKQLADVHDCKLPTDLVGQSWTATTFMSYFLQRLSSAANMAAAAEIRNQIVKGPRLPRAGARPRGMGRGYRSAARA